MASLPQDPTLPFVQNLPPIDYTSKHSGMQRWHPSTGSVMVLNPSFTSNPNWRYEDGAGSATIGDVIARHHPQFHDRLRTISGTLNTPDGTSILALPAMNGAQYANLITNQFPLSMRRESRLRQGNLRGTTDKLTTNAGGLVELHMSGYRDSYCVGFVTNSLLIDHPEIVHAAQNPEVVASFYHHKMVDHGDKQIPYHLSETLAYGKPVDVGVLHKIGETLGLLNEKKGFDDLKVGSVIGFGRSLETRLAKWKASGSKGNPPTQSELEERGGSHVARIIGKGSEGGRDYIVIASGNGPVARETDVAGRPVDAGDGGFYQYRIYRDEISPDGVVRENGGTGRPIVWHMDSERMQAYSKQYRANREQYLARDRAHLDLKDLVPQAVRTQLAQAQTEDVPNLPAHLAKSTEQHIARVS